MKKDENKSDNNKSYADAVKKKPSYSIHSVKYQEEGDDTIYVGFYAVPAHRKKKFDENPYIVFDSTDFPTLIIFTNEEYEKNKEDAVKKAQEVLQENYGHCLKRPPLSR